MPQLIPFEPEHLSKIRYRDWDEKFLTSKTIDVSVKGPAWTAVEGDKIIACAGVDILWPGVGDAWLITCPEISTYKFWFYKTLKRVLYGIIEDYKLHRVQSDAEQAFVDSCNMLRHLGFRKESIMQNYGPGKESFVRFVIL